ncbi:MAG TPA: SRPBCC domain-containing protein [Symbiobacteriaceae bacterium]|nr:SRPBCC domain-containing protein [Symbiobacteriaceae bacterium]
MYVTGHFHFHEDPATVYRAFTDKDALMFATPGLQQLTEIAPDHYEAVMRAGVGGFYLVYHGKMLVTERVHNRSYRLQVDAKTHNGTAHVDMQIQFEPSQQGGTRVEYQAEVDLGGAQKLLPSLARGMVDFFMRGVMQWLQEAQTAVQTEAG